MNRCVLRYLLLQAVFPLFQADFFGSHELQSFFGNGVLQTLHAFDRRCPRRLAELPLVGAHPLVQSCNDNIHVIVRQGPELPQFLQSEDSSAQLS